MRRVWIAIAMGLVALLPLTAGEGDEGLEERIEELETWKALDRVELTGDLRVTADSIDATLAERFDGLALQKGIVDTIFYFGATGQFPMGPEQVNQFIAENYGSYLYYRDNLSFDGLKSIFGMFPAESQQALMGMLLPGTFVPEQDYANDIIYTTRLRLGLRAKVMKDVTFEGRLTMYKTWGDSTGVQVFNGTPNSFTIDGANGGTPNSDILRVDRAYFNWKHLGGSDWYLSAGRRPSTYGPPLHIRDNERRQGTPNGHVVNFQFDGITLGRTLYDWLPGNTFRFCYGLGFESGFGSADQLQAPADRLNDVHLGGINWDFYNTDATSIQVTALGAWDVTDGFNGLIVLPADPVSGDTVPAPVIMRYTPSANLGDLYMADVLLERRELNFTWFLSYAYMMSKADAVTTPFGGLFCDPFEVPEDQDGWSVYAGIRAPVGQTGYIGFEYNYGSEYWFNFTQGAEDLVASKLATRGSAYELYWLKGFSPGLGRAKMNLRLSAMYYDYSHSGSGWHVGRPKDLDSTQILAFPTYSEALDARLSLLIKL